MNPDRDHEANAAPEPASDRILVARFARAHGVRGDVQAIPETDDPARLTGLAEVFVGETPGTARPYRAASVRVTTTKHGATLLVRLDGVDTPEAAGALRGLGLYAPASALPLSEGEFFLHDLVGLAVLTEAGEAVGTVREVLDLPAHAVFVVAREGRPDVLIPDVEAFVAEVDLDGRRLVIRPIEGLIDDADADTV